MTVSNFDRQMLLLCFEGARVRTATDRRHILARLFSGSRATCNIFWARACMWLWGKGKIRGRGAEWQVGRDLGGPIVNSGPEKAGIGGSIPPLATTLTI